ncbi:flagellar biosynthetic protein FliR [Yoonia sp. 2307UL14-13]|uniref:flagellar biosynthetic protein FliR n=1 Tax=Yoonia sp. 2307UL14-13 TaxID=3126506 RepID=UPI0030A28DE1
MILIALRPFGLLLGFLAMTWALKSALMLRLSIAIALALPTIGGNLDAIEALIVEPNALQLAPLSLKEFGLGYALGFLASLPFFALQYAGAITDAFRGENETGTPDPGGGTLHTFSVMYLVIGFFAFFSFGGFERLIENLYSSYIIWPVSFSFPTFSASVGLQAVDILTRTIISAIWVALPLLGMLVVIELAVSVAARLGRRFNFYDMAFPLKNLATALTLPLTAWLIWGLSDEKIAESSGALMILQRFFE